MSKHIKTDAIMGLLLLLTPLLIVLMGIAELASKVKAVVVMAFGTGAQRQARTAKLAFRAWQASDPYDYPYPVQ